MTSEELMKEMQKQQSKQSDSSRLMAEMNAATVPKTTTTTSNTPNTTKKYQTAQDLIQNAKKYGAGNIDLTNRPIVRNDDGSISTVRSMSFNEDGKEVLIPTVVNGKAVSNQEAIDNYHNTGEYLGKFDTVDQANNYAEYLHNQQDQLYSTKAALQKAKESNKEIQGPADPNSMTRVYNKVLENAPKVAAQVNSNESDVGDTDTSKIGSKVKLPSNAYMDENGNLKLDKSETAYKTEKQLEAEDERANRIYENNYSNLSNDELEKQYYAYLELVQEDIKNERDSQARVDQAVADKLKYDLQTRDSIGYFAKNEANTAWTNVKDTVANVADWTVTLGNAFFNNATGDISPAGLYAYNYGKKVGITNQNGEQVISNEDQRSIELLRRFAEKNPNIPRLQTLYQQLSTHTYEGTKEDIKKELNRIQYDINHAFIDSHTIDEHKDLAVQNATNSAVYEGRPQKVALDTTGTIARQIPSMLVANAVGGLTNLASGGLVNNSLIMPIADVSNIAPTLASEASLSVLYADAANNAYNQAIEKGADENTAILYADLVGNAEKWSEKVGGENIINGVIGVTGTESSINKFIKAHAGNNWNWGIALLTDVAGESTEEMLTQGFDPLWRNISGLEQEYNFNTAEGWGEYLGGILEAGVESIPSSVVLGGTGLVQTRNMYNKVENSVLESLQNSGLTNKEKIKYKKNIEAYFEQAKKSLDQNYTEYALKVSEALDDIQTRKEGFNPEKIDTLKSAVNDFQRSSQETTSINTQNQNLTQNNANESILQNNGQNLNQNEQNSLENDYNALNLVDKTQEKISKSLNQETPLGKQIVQLVENGYTIPKNTQDALQHLQDTRDGLTINFDTNIKGIGQYDSSTRTITLNPNNLDRAVEFTTTHELLHDIKNVAPEEYAELQNFVLEYAKTRPDYESSKANLNDIYTKGTSSFNLNDEATNDMVAETLGNQEFLNELGKKNPNIFQRAWNWIKNVLFDGEKRGITFEERRYLNELQNKFKKAYEVANSTKSTELSSYNSLEADKVDISKNSNYNDYENSNLDKSNVQEGELKNNFYKALTKSEWKKYHTKMNKVMATTSDDLGRTDIINNKIVTTEIKNSKEQVISVLKVKDTNLKELSNNIEELGEFYGYSNGEIEEIISKVYGEENVSRYDSSSGKFIPLTNSTRRDRLSNRESSDIGREKSKEGNLESSSKEYSLNENSDIDNKIKTSMTMNDAKRMIQLAFNDNKISDWYDGKYKTADEWLEGEGTDEVANYVENTESSITKYINPLYSDQSFDDGDYTIEDIINAYKDKTLTGKQDVRENIDTSVDTGYQDDRFYAPKNVELTQELYDKANQKAVGKDKNEVYKARADFVIAAHNMDAVEKLGLDIKEINTKLRHWSNYTKEARELSQSVNDGVARQNQWSGLENSSLINSMNVSNEQLGSLVKEIKGDSSGWQRKYITSTMLAIDTHIDYKGLTFEFDQSAELHKNHANGDYNHNTNVIRIGDAYQETVAHEMGHYIDFHWAEEIFGNSGMSLSERTYSNNSDYNLTDAQKKFLNNFRNFIKDISNSATIGTKYSIRNGSYWQNNSEVFARFTAEFTEWVKNKASNDSYSYEREHYGNPFNDNFTVDQYKEFIKLLQEKSALDTNKIENSNVEYSENGKGKWQQFLDDNFNLMPNATRTYFEKQQQNIENDADIYNSATGGIEVEKKPKVMPLEDIAHMTTADVKQDPMKYKVHNESKKGRTREFFNTAEDSDIVAQETKDAINKSLIKTKHNSDTMNKMYDKLNEQGNTAVNEWQLKPIKDFTDEDVAMGAILKQRYEADGDYDSAARVIEKLAEASTSAARTLQMYSIFDRLSPETMARYEQLQLDKAFDLLKKSKTGEWVKANKSKFELTGDDVKFINEQVEKANQCVNEQDKQRELSRIENMINDKLPAEKGTAFKTLRRMAMLFNPKTQVRNVTGNALIMPVNYAVDLVSTQIDKAVAKRTGIRTTNYTNLSDIGQGMVKGLKDEITDFKTGTRTTKSGNRWEMETQGKPFNEHNEGLLSNQRNAINNKLNGLNNVLSAVMEGGDRIFYEAAYQNSLNGQMKANNVTEPTQEMIDIAVNEALSRTWNDSNEYTQFVLGFRRALNVINFHGVGIGDLIIPFAKTPANLTKAMVEYSPAGLVEAWFKYNEMDKAISRGEMTAQQQKNFVNLVGKGVVGTFMYMIAHALVKSGAVSGSKDDDKDVADYEQNVLGIQPYSIRIGDKSYTYSWANPINAPLAIMADWNKLTSTETDPVKKLWQLARTASNVLGENSFLQGVTEFFGEDDYVEGLVKTLEDLPASMIPTFSSQFASLFDDTKRQTYDKNNETSSTINSVKYKIPGLRNQLAPQVNTFGEEVSNQNNVFNTFFNPANVREAEVTDTQQEVYSLYEATQDKTIFPRQAPYYFAYKDEQVKLSSQDRATFQKAEGQYTNDTLDALFDTDYYKNSSNQEKIKTIKSVLDDSVLVGKASIGYETDDYTKYQEKMDALEDSGIPIADYYIAYNAQKDIKGDKNAKGNTISGSTKKNKIQAIEDATGLNSNESATLYEIFN